MRKKILKGLVIGTILMVQAFPIVANASNQHDYDWWDLNVSRISGCLTGYTKTSAEAETKREAASQDVYMKAKIWAENSGGNTASTKEVSYDKYFVTTGRVYVSSSWGASKWRSQHTTTPSSDPYRYLELKTSILDN